MEMVTAVMCVPGKGESLVTTLCHSIVSNLFTRRRTIRAPSIQTVAPSGAPLCPAMFAQFHPPLVTGTIPGGHQVLT